MKDCVFCKIVSGEFPCYKIYEDDYTLAFLDIAGDCYGHTLVVPKKHCQNILDCDGETLARVTATVQKVARHFVRCGFEGVNVLNANGACAEQSVFHLHVHVIPRAPQDGIEAWPFKDKHDFDMQSVCDRLTMCK